MKELTPDTLIAVFEEMFGTWLFWAMVVAAAIITLAYLYVLVRDRAMSMRKFLWAQICMPVGAVVAVAFVLWITNSRLVDMGGPVDVMLLLAIAVFGAIGVSILVYTTQSLIWPPNRSGHRAKER